MSVWTCQRVTAGAKCGHKNAGRKRKCEACGKTRPPRKRPDHLAALGEGYESYVERTGGEFCSICGREASGTRKLHRDHCHKTGTPRALLCFRCNSALRSYMTSDWLRRAADYLDRFA